MMENIRIYLFGTFRFYRNGLLLTAKDWQVRQARQLFKLLFTEREHTVPADKMIDLLWSDSAENAHKTLRSAISILRTVLEPERTPQAASLFVPRGSTGYMLHLPSDNSVWVDTLEFERLLEMANAGSESLKKRRLLESALQLYAGDYLAEDERESWTFAERARLRERYFAAAQSLMEVQRRQKLYSQAIAIGRRALSFDTCREPLYPLIMYCQAALGDTVGALQTFEQCRQELHHRLGVYPSPQTLALHTELLQGEFEIELTKHPASLTRISTRPLSTSHDTAAKKGESLFVGRQAVLQSLTYSIDILYEEHRQPQAKHVITVAGEVGSGKSFLLRAVLDYAQTLHATIMTTSCQQIEQETIFTPLLLMIKTWLTTLRDDELSALPQATLAILSHFLPELLERLPQLEPASFLNKEQAQSVFISGFVDMFLALSQQRPLILALDDVQWIDEASLHVLYRLALATKHTNTLLLLLFYRPEDVPENEVVQTTLLSLGYCNTFETVYLPALTTADIREYLHEQNMPLYIPVEQWYKMTRGNPLLLVETARLYSKQDATNTTNLLDLALQSQKIHDVFLARIARLPLRALELLEIAAVIDRPFPPELLSCPLCAEDCKMLDVLLARRFLLTMNRKEYEVYLVCSHEILTRIVYENCSVLKRSQLHLQVAVQMECYYAHSLDSHATDIAYHYRHAGPQYQQRIQQYV